MSEEFQNVRYTLNGESVHELVENLFKNFGEKNNRVLKDALCERSNLLLMTEKLASYNPTMNLHDIWSTLELMILIYSDLEKANWDIDLCMVGSRIELTEGNDQDPNSSALNGEHRDLLEKMYNHYLKSLPEPEPITLSDKFKLIAGVMEKDRLRDAQIKQSYAYSDKSIEIVKSFGDLDLSI